MEIGIAKTDVEREATYRFLNDEVSAQHSSLMEEARSIDTKATFVAGFAAAALPFFLGNPRGTLWWLALGAYMTSFAVALAALWPRRWDGLKPTALLGELAEGAPVIVVGKVAGTKVVLYKRNSGRLRNKTIMWAISVGILAVGIAFFSVEHDSGGSAMSKRKTGKERGRRTRRSVKPVRQPSETPAEPQAPTERKSLMVADERLIGRSIVASGPP